MPSPRWIRLLPPWGRPCGYGLITAGVVWGALELWLVFRQGADRTVTRQRWSSLFDVERWASLRNNLSLEIPALLLLGGLLLVTVSREPEESIAVTIVRLNTLLYALLINGVLVMGAIVFTFGTVFGHILVANLFSMLTIYVLLFRIEMRRMRSQSSYRSVPEKPRHHE